MAVKSNNIKLDLAAKTILKINQQLIKKFGEPYRNFSSDPLDILIATILSQNTNDLNSHKAFLNIKKEFPNYNDLINADINSIEKLIKVAGLSKQKSKTIKSVLTGIKKEKGKLSLHFLNSLSIDEALKYLCSFNGIGLKTAACVLLFGLHKNICPVDTHIHRILNRIGILTTSSRDKTFYVLLNHLPEGIAHQFHTNLIKLGRTICLSRKPKCYECPLKGLCKYEKKNLIVNKNDKSTGNRNKDFMLLDLV